MFVISCLQQLEPIDGQVSVVAVAPTRELAFQIKNEFGRFAKYMENVRYETFYGGVGIQKDIDLLKDPATCPHIVVCTPGRLWALVQGKHMSMKHMKIFVIDECDKILENGGEFFCFFPLVRFVPNTVRFFLDMRRDVQWSFNPPAQFGLDNVFKSDSKNGSKGDADHDKAVTKVKRQVMMFTATLNDDIKNTCRLFLRNPLEIMVDGEAQLTLHGLTQYIVRLPEAEKNRQLNELLDTLDFNQVVIFVKSIKRATELEKLVKFAGFPCMTIHSGLPQDERLKRYNAFKNFSERVCVATDVFARGIDIERVNLVVNYDMTVDSDSYLHRVGRAGRFGTKGLTVTFLSSEDDEAMFAQIKNRLEISVDEYPADGDVPRELYTNA